MTRRRSKQRILCLWLPNWPLQRVRRERPALKRCQLSLYQSQRGALRVIASDRYAVGTPLAEVVTGKAELHDSKADELALLELAAWCEQFSPTIGIEGADNLCFDVTGLEQLVGSEQVIVKQVLQAFNRQGLIVRIAVADTVGAAWALAHYGDLPCIVSVGRAALRSLPVAALRLGEETGILNELGIETIGQLLSVPADALACRFGPQLLLRVNQALGCIPEPIVSHRPPPEIEVETKLESPLNDRQAVEVLVRDLLHQVAATLVERQQGALQLRCELDCEGTSFAFTVSLFRPSANPWHLLELARMQLDRVKLHGPIGSVRIAVLAKAPLSAWQQELFDGATCERSRHVGLLIDRLSNRLGRAAVVRALAQQESQPELAVRYEPLAGAARSRSKQRFRKLPRPLRLEIKPLPVETLAVIPDGPPLQFRFDGDHRVVQAWGPERIQTGWWRGRYVQRDYYRVETETGQRFWLFRQLGDDEWFLHGAFD